MDFCTYESRPEDSIGVKLLALSLQRYEPDAKLHVVVGSTDPSLVCWLNAQPNVLLHRKISPVGRGWNIKPSVLLQFLEAGFEEIVWIDADILITGPVGGFFKNRPKEQLVVAEEFYTFRYNGAQLRTRELGLTEGQDPDGVVNSGLVRVTKRHTQLLREWQDLLNSKQYLALQSLPWQERPRHMMGDQDALAALVGSAPYTGIDLAFVRRGKDIAQCFQADGYAPWERLKNWNRLPTFLHAQGQKPWRNAARGVVYLEVSPYRIAAESYASELSSEESEWLHPSAAGARLLQALFLNHPSLAGFLPCVTAFVIKRLKSAMRLLPYQR